MKLWPIAGQTLPSIPANADRSLSLTCNGDRVSVELKECDRVLFAKYAGTEFKHEADELLILSEKDILGILSNGQ